MSRDDPFDALRPTADEIDAVRRPLPDGLRRQAADWTAPTPGEIARLQARQPQRLPAPPARGWVPVLLAAAALLSLRLAPLPEPPPPPPPAPITADHALEIPHGPLHLNEDIDAEGDGIMAVQQQSEGGARVTVTDGAVTFTVDPAGRGRDLRVQAGPVEVRVTGTRFTVARDAAAEAVTVSVARGSVAIHAPSGDHAIGAGEQWRWAPPVAALRPVPAPAPAPAPDPVPTEEASTALFVSIMDAEASAAAPQRLLSMTETFLRVYGDSPFREEVAVLRLETLAQVSPEDALVEVEAWLEAHPGSPRRWGLLLLAGGLAEQGSGCRSALPYYTEVVAAPDPRLQEQGRARVEMCAEP